MSLTPHRAVDVSFDYASIIYLSREPRKGLYKSRETPSNRGWNTASVRKQAQLIDGRQERQRQTQKRFGAKFQDRAYHFPIFGHTPA